MSSTARFPTELLSPILLEWLKLASPDEFRNPDTSYQSSFSLEPSRTRAKDVAIFLHRLAEMKRVSWTFEREINRLGLGSSVVLLHGPRIESQTEEFIKLQMGGITKTLQIYAGERLSSTDEEQGRLSLSILAVMMECRTLHRLGFHAISVCKGQEPHFLEALENVFIRNSSTLRELAWESADVFVLDVVHDWR